MKKFVSLRSKACQVGALIVACLLMVGCNSGGQGQDTTVTPVEPEVERQQMEIEVEGASASQEGNTITLDYPVQKDKNNRLPVWVINPGTDGVLGAVGVGPVCQLGTKEQLDEARLNARLELAQMLELRLQGIDRGQLEQQTQAMGDSVQDNSRKNILGVDRSISDIVLAGSRQRALWFDPDNGECYVWIVLDGDVLEKVDHYVNQDVSTFVANTPIDLEYKPERRQPKPPTVVVDMPEQAAPAPEILEPVEELEEKLPKIETIPLKGETVK
jgi:hypothetical protein